VSRGADLRSAVLKIGVSHATSNVYSPKPVETYRHGQCYGHVKIFSFRFINRVAMGVFTRRTLLKHKYEDNVKGLVFFFSVEYIFSFGFSVGLNGNNN